MSILRRIEKTLDARMRGIFGGSGTGPGSREAIELYRDALSQIAARATVGVRQDRVFPFDRIRVELAPGAPEHRSMLEALFVPEQMAGDVQATLLEEGVTVPAGLTLAVEYPENLPVEMRVICEKATATTAPAAPVRSLVPMRLVTLAGLSSAPDFPVDRPHVNLGRVDEVLDSLGRAVRRNDLFFPETAAEANASVSRAHAHIRFEGATGEWRIYDDGSSLGTSVFREGRRIDVPAHAGRGVMLRAGDEIYLGQARLRFEAA
jgi:hypothetical protein